MTKPQIKWISRDDPPDAFPPISTALRSPNGLLAAGGDLASERLLHAYEHAIFPWFDTGQPILWWSPDPRCVLLPEGFHVSRRFNRTLKASSFRISFNEVFDRVISACSGRRDEHSGTWITPDMIAAYSKLHRLGWAHSVEVWLETKLVGGIYGIAIGGAFFGESMFSHVANASKVAALALCQQLAKHDFRVVDCQVPSPHLMSLGATLMPRDKFAGLLQLVCTPRKRFDKWPDAPIEAALLGDA
ncbi:MAG: leucyl/phenylalanyl-tRNA--protein transferase [Woeseia sp.]